METHDSDSRTGEVQLRDVEGDDLLVFFEQQSDPVANRIAAFPARDLEAFLMHWKERVLGTDAVIKKTVLFRDRVAGNIVCYESSGEWLVGYWLGREFWGRGIATIALATFLGQIERRPLVAYVAKRNIGSIRVLEKCGFALTGERSAAALEVGEVCEELVFTLST